MRLLVAIGFSVLVASAAAQEAVERRALFGDLHIHTSWSFDAYISSVRTTPDDAYRFGKGEEIAIAGGGMSKLSQPLDFMAVTDHAEFLGMFLNMADPDHPISTHPLAADIVSGDPQRARRAFFQITAQAAAGQPPGDEYFLGPDEPAMIWAEMVAAADRHYAPGTFTTFAGFEWSSLNRFVNLHRNIIFKDTARVAKVPYSMLDSYKPEDLWAWMDGQRAEGIDLLAIPHNGNMSKGRMYPFTDSEGADLDRDYAETRRRNEPINEVVQIKGQSMTHPVLASEDEFADFETYNFTVGSANAEEEEVPAGSYAQQGLQRGLLLEDKIGLNPFAFGLIGSSDSHNSNTPVDEFTFPGSSGVQDATPESRLTGEARVTKRSSGGLAAVWAEENTRESIYAALERRETYATSGTRIQVRLFAGWDFADSYDDATALARDGYAKGVPMGSDISGTDGSAPVLLVWAMKDPGSANLDRIQIVKGWLDDGEAYEAIYDVALSDGRVVAEDGTVPPNGATVNMETGEYSSDIGAVQLFGRWTDPDFDPDQSAYYFARVLENPTLRWSTWDSIRNDMPLSDVVPATIQERAWSSPIWYSPAR